jgi:glycerate kinase
MNRPRPSRRVRILLCPDSFKGSLTAVDAARAMARGVRRARPGARTTLVPLADGGEGTLTALALAGGRWQRTRVTGPLGTPVTARWLRLPGRVAVIEMAEAAGLLLVPRHRRDPLRATTRGVGEVMAAALRAGARRLVVTLGGSATVDGGAGMAAALGARLLDTAGRPIPPGGGGLAALRSIDARALRRRLRGVTILGVTDVTSPLLGARGAARVFGPQKGASATEVAVLERGLAHFARLCRRDLGRDIARSPGAGAAGGLGAGLLAFCGARLGSGADYLFARLGFDRALARANLVLTGEGNLDAQTAAGKLVARVARRARRHGVPVVAFAGRVWLSPAATRRLGLAAAFSLSARRISRTESLRRAAELLEARVAGELPGLLASHGHAGPRPRRVRAVQR